jgi:hypothetical protein
VQDQFTEAIALIQSGKNKEARKILKRILEKEPNNEAAWIWLSVAADTEEEKNYYLEQLAARNLDPHPPAANKDAPAKKVKAEERRFTVEDIRAIRETYESQTLGFLAGKNARPSIEIAKIHNLNEAQVFAIRSLPQRHKISDEEIASKLHLLTDQMQTLQDIADVFGIKL